MKWCTQVGYWTAAMFVWKKHNTKYFLFIFQYEDFRSTVIVRYFTIAYHVITAIEFMSKFSVDKWQIFFSTFNCKQNVCILGRVNKAVIIWFEEAKNGNTSSSNWNSNCISEYPWMIHQLVKAILMCMYYFYPLNRHSFNENKNVILLIIIQKIVINVQNSIKLAQTVYFKAWTEIKFKFIFSTND